MSIKKIAKVALFSVTLITTSLPAFSRVNKGFNWNPLMDAITIVESGGDSRAVSGTQCGAMQIMPILVEDCNAILKQRGEKKRYSLNDRFNVKKSREMFVLIMSRYNPTNDIEKAIRIWNGGANYTTKGTQRYYQKVMAQYKSE